MLSLIIINIREDEVVEHPEGFKRKKSPRLLSLGDMVVSLANCLWGCVGDLEFCHTKANHVTSVIIIRCKSFEMESEFKGTASDFGL